MASTGHASHALSKLSERSARDSKDGQPLVVEAKGPGRFLDAVAEPDAELAVDPHPEPVDDALLEPFAHIPSSSSSVRARSMISGVSSVMLR